MERLHDRGTLDLVEMRRKILVSYTIEAYQNYILSEGYGGSSEDASDFTIEGTLVIGEAIPRVPFPTGETTILELKDGRHLNINLPGLLQPGGTYRINSLSDYMDFFDGPMYKKDRD
ncbi:MAG TPA: hypothetical protein VNJ70_01095 [Thermoanaerobaculia bacterium]|nr:hypothetical protein [Thermoanaerobaculia bacterium]